jgi:hypothetical protein
MSRLFVEGVWVDGERSELLDQGFQRDETVVQSRLQINEADFPRLKRRLATLDDLRFVAFDIEFEEVEVFDVPPSEKAIDGVNPDFLLSAIIWFRLVESGVEGVEYGRLTDAHLDRVRLWTQGELMWVVETE